MSRFLISTKSLLSYKVTLTASEASLVAQMVKNLPAMQETWFQSLGQEDPLEKGMAIHSHSCLVFVYSPGGKFYLSTEESI